MTPTQHPAVYADAAALLRRLSLPRAAEEAVTARLRGIATAGAAALPPGWRWEPDPAGGAQLLEQAPGGARPWGLLDRVGRLQGAFAWRGATLVEAWFRLPGASWLELRPRVGTHPLWGASDALLHHAAGAPAAGARPAGSAVDAVLGLLPAQDYAALETVPAFDRPASLPPGAGSAVLNFLSMLLRLQGAERVHYHGPYPTPALFAALQRSFVPEGDAAAAQALFTRDETALAFRGVAEPNALAWRPAPFAASSPRPELLLHWRDGLEAAWVGTVPFRAAPRSGPLPAGERVWHESAAQGGGYAVGLVLLGRPAARFYRIGPDGDVRQAAPWTQDGEPDAVPQVLAPLWREAVFAWATVRAHAGLAGAVQALERTATLHWHPLALQLAAAAPDGVRVQSALAAAFRQRRAAEDAAALGMMLVSDVLGAVTPHLLRRAQAQLAAGPRSEPRALVLAGEAAQARARAVLERALPRLVQALAQGEALPDGDLPDVQAPAT